MEGQREGESNISTLCPIATNSGNQLLSVVADHRLRQPTVTCKLAEGQQTLLLLLLLSYDISITVNMPVGVQSCQLTATQGGAQKLAMQKGSQSAKWLTMGSERVCNSSVAHVLCQEQRPQQQQQQRREEKSVTSLSPLFNCNRGQQQVCVILNGRANEREQVRWHSFRLRACLC